MTVLAVLVAPFVLGAPALAADALPGPEAYAGRWDFSGDTEGSGACVLEMRTPRIIGGYEMSLGKGCSAVFPDVEEIYAWRPSPGGGIAFADATRHTVLDFRPTADGAFVARASDGTGYVLGRRRATRPQGMGGTWALNALGGKRLCTFQLDLDRTGKSGSLARRAPCAAPWSSRSFGSWTLRSGRLVLKSPRGAALLSFRQGDPVTFEGQTPRGEAIYFVRP